MTRTHNDTWDLASSVGATATMVAAARAVATGSDGALISDPYAGPLVRAVGVEVFNRLVDGDLKPEDFDDEDTAGMSRMVDNMAVRTKYFDDFFVAATAAGIKQAVILASGLDSRAYRLKWPAGTVVFEVDQPEVIEFKTRALADIGAEPTADRRAVAIDLRFDWPLALRDAGFDPGQPTAWSAEGLFGYLPPDAQDRLIDTVSALSARGSRFATESALNIDPADLDEAKEKMASTADRWRNHGFDLDFANLVYMEDRKEVASYLAERGWQVDGATVNDLMTANGLTPFDSESPFAELRYVTGVRGGNHPKASASEDRSEARTGGPTPAGQGTRARRGIEP